MEEPMVKKLNLKKIHFPMISNIYNTLKQLFHMLNKYDIEIDRIVNEAKKIEAKNIILQLPDGLKMNAVELTRKIEAKTGCTVTVWAGSNFGACDVPTNLPKEYDLMVAVGHAFAYNKKD